MAHRAESSSTRGDKLGILPREVRDWKIFVMRCQKDTSLADMGQKWKLNLYSSGNNGDLVGSIISRQGPPRDHDGKGDHKSLEFCQPAWTHTLTQ